LPIFAVPRIDAFNEPVPSRCLFRRKVIAFPPFNHKH
jgi:hypothetical protein